MDTDAIGEVARRTGVTERTLRYYEELGLLAPRRDAGGHRRYGPGDVDRLYRIRLLRELGTPLAEVEPDRADLVGLTSRHLSELDARLAELTRQRERVRTVEARLMSGVAPADAELIGVLRGLPDADDAVTRRLTLLVYADIGAAQSYLVDVFGFAPGELARDEDGVVVHGEVVAGDGVIWLHRVAPEFGLESPRTLGAATACLSVLVDDVEAHHERATAAGAAVVHPPQPMPYGVREYAVRDLEGHLWSFGQVLEGDDDE